MRILILGGHEMAGHMLFNYLSRCSPYELFYTATELHPKVKPERALFWDPEDMVMVEKLVALVRPNVIVNSSGVWYDLARQQEISAYRINALLPHQLAKLAERYGARLVQISSDGVFEGSRGNYEEIHVPDGTSVFAKTKALGEVKAPHVTIRVSMFGPELVNEPVGLFEWFMRQRGGVKGFVNVAWNGVTTLELAKFICFLIEKQPRLNGIIHLTGKEMVSKYNLLEQCRVVFKKRDVQIKPNDVIDLDRTLKSTRSIQYETPTIKQMLEELRDWMNSSMNPS
ncbi:dTDP-4-dehydrorhamnose reductase family protein [Paenibacillus radicis (ex Xue et al. 2023)]|uniref:dTDP-4-dehydrorhamnose reductase n=1 Tax=Paenibacillus radicis (ex Xue et al. 2023) TaxID=2972489 RepID=A0ABT1YSC1_9BACL|nr:SDR family oxidoreductase [Paenibacillus radicis (ex Xue et al. 2023)]MCR8636082.1 SDR family oxidoreductase [Paenibacillus radicis (ex Xue et al. 2023)]